MEKLIFIVSREAPDVYEHLLREFSGTPEIEVMLDRRFRERRTQPGATVGAERRRSERRTHSIKDYLQTLGWAIVRSTSS